MDPLTQGFIAAGKLFDLLKVIFEGQTPEYREKHWAFWQKQLEVMLQDQASIRNFFGLNK